MPDLRTRLALDLELRVARFQRADADKMLLRTQRALVKDGVMQGLAKRIVPRQSLRVHDDGKLAFVMLQPPRMATTDARLGNCSLLRFQASMEILSERLRA